MSLTKKIALTFFVSAGLFFSLSFYSMYKVNSQVISSKNKIQNNSYVGEYEISNLEFNKFKEKLNEIENELISQKITLKINDKEYTYELKELGVGINKDEILSKVIEYEDNLDYWTLYNNYSKNNFEKVTYKYRYIIDENKLMTFLEKIKNEVNIVPKKGKLFMNSQRELEYIDEIVGFELDVEKSLEIIKNNFNSLDFKEEIELVGENTYTNDALKQIDTKISSFTTNFDASLGRKYNLIAGAKYIDGKIVYPNQVFSFFETAGPYTKEGYVYYLGMKGNGVCQVATTLYNAQLLAGLTTVTRYNHGVKSVYVAGGLDATVAVTKGYVTDYKFKNNYKYPIYISAYVSGGKLTVEIWSNKDAKGGIEYKTESVRHGYGSYTAYRYAYKDGKLINKEKVKEIDER